MTKKLHAVLVERRWEAYYNNEILEIENGY
jgi:hypothetical protein